MARHRRPRGGWDYQPDWGYFPPSKPLEAKGGIRAESKKGAFGSNWWARRWIAVLESFEIGGRLNRGRAYARKGQVLDVKVGEGRATARVQGSRPEPYDVAIAMKVFTPAERKALGAALSKQALHAAKLLAGEMPPDIEDVFREAGLALFPEKLGDLTTKCSCPDWSNPCKHVAAVYYLLGEEFDRDPFLLLTIRGLGRKALLDLLGKATKGRKKAPAEPAAPAPEPLAADPRAFWDGVPVGGDDFFGPVAAPPVDAALPRRLGKFPFWRGRKPLLEAVEPAYAAATPRGLDAFLGVDASATADADGPGTPGRSG